MVANECSEEPCRALSRNDENSKAIYHSISCDDGGYDYD
jgi:hypothetical protein